MRVILIGLMFFLTITLQAENKKKLYSITIDVEAKKANGKSWDVFGGSPDIKVVIDGETFYSPTKCKDRYRCTMEFTSVKDKWYIEVYDKDLQSDDLIGKGDCKDGEECKFGLVTISISD